MNVVKTMSENEESVTVLEEETTTKDSTKTTATASEADQVITSTASIPQQEPATEEQSRVEDGKVAVNQTRFGDRRPAFRLPQGKIQIHPFITKLSNSEAETTTRIVHPFLHQIKPTIPTSNNVTETVVSTEETSSTTIQSTTESTPSPIPTRPSLFGKFNLLSKNRPNFLPVTSDRSRELDPESVGFTESAVSTESVVSTLPTPTAKKSRPTPASVIKTENNFLKSFNRPRFTLPSRITAVKNEEEVENDENIIDTEVNTKGLKSPKISPRLSKPTFSRPNLLAETLKDDIENSVETENPSPNLRFKPSFIHSSILGDSSKVPVFSTIEKPRPKRLPSPFSGSRSSLFSNRFTKPSLEPTTASTTTAVVAEEEDIKEDGTTTTTISNRETTSTEKQTVGDLIAQLNGEDTDEDVAVTLRPKAFKPKFGSSNKIREKLKAELAVEKENGGEKEEENEEKDDDIDDVNFAADELYNTATEPTAARANPTRFSPTRLVPNRESSVSRSETRPSNERTNRNRLKTRQRTLSATTKPIVNNNFDVTEEDIFKPTVVSPESHRTNDILESLVTVDNMHAGDTESENNIVTAKSPFQVLENSAENQAHDLVNDNQPEINFRQLKPDLLPTDPQTFNFEQETTIDEQMEFGLTVTEEMILPTTQAPRALGNVPSTAEAFLPTVQEPMFLPTVRKSSDPFPSSAPEPSSTESTDRRVRIRTRGRQPVVNRAPQQQQEPLGPAQRTVTRPIQDRQRVRERARTPVGFTEGHSSESETTESVRTVPQRLVSRARTIPNTPVFTPRTSGKINQNLRIRGGGRRRVSTAPEQEEPVTPEKPEQEGTTESRPRGKEVVSIEDITTVETTEEVDTTVAVVSKQELDSDIEITTVTSGGFVPKDGAQTRNKLREKLNQELKNNRTRQFVFSSSEVGEDFSLTQVPVPGSERNVPDHFQDMASLPGSERKVEDTFQDIVPIPGPERKVPDLFHDMVPVTELELNVSDQLQTMTLPEDNESKTETPNTSSSLYEADSVSKDGEKETYIDENIAAEDREEETAEEEEDVVEPEIETAAPRQGRRFNPVRSELNRSKPNVKSNLPNRRRLINQSESLRTVVYDPRSARQVDIEGFMTEATVSLRRPGRSTLSSAGFTEKPMQPADFEDSSVSSLTERTEKKSEFLIKPFLLRGGKGERKLFSGYKTEINTGSVPEKKSNEKTAGPNPSIDDFVEKKEDRKSELNLAAKGSFSDFETKAKKFGLSKPGKPFHFSKTFEFGSKGTDERLSGVKVHRGGTPFPLRLSAFLNPRCLNPTS